MRNKIFPLLMTGILILVGCDSPTKTNTALKEEILITEKNIIGLDYQKIITSAEKLLEQEPVTITSFKAERSAGGIHDYYSEGSYWWQNPDDPDGPFVRRDGERNPNNFTAHKKVLREFCMAVATLTAAYELTSDERFANHAAKHLEAWFVNSATRMNPNLLYAQAIKGISTGRGIGIIDTVRLIHVAMSILFLEEKKILKGESLVDIKKWFSDYSEWLTTHPYGIAERDNNNNHSTWWGVQVAAYSKVAERDEIFTMSQTQFKKQLDVQMAEDGSFPKELSRTKPFHYVNYNLRAWTSFALLASTPTENLWTYSSKNGSLQKAVDFIMPYYNNPNTWNYKTLVEKEIHPQRNDFLLFTYWGTGKKEYLELWKSLKKSDNKIGAREEHLVLWVNKLLR